VVLLQDSDSTEARVLVEGELPETKVFPIPTGFTADGRQLLVNSTEIATGETEIHLLPLTDGNSGDALETTLLIPDAREARASRDGKWLAYLSDASTGREELYVRGFDGNDLGPAIPIFTTDGASLPMWRATSDGEELLYFSPERRAFSVTITGESTHPEISAPREIISKAVLDRVDDNISAPIPLPDGRFLMVVQGDDEQDPTALRLELNWGRELERKMAAAR
jgi:hypothetical protein